MGTLQISQVLKKLQNDVLPFVDVADLSNQKGEYLDNHKITRALTAFVISKVAGLETKDAAACVTDESSDQGIDGIAITPDSSRIVLVQSKWSNSGKGSASKPDMAAFRDGVNSLLSLKFEKFGPKIRSRQEEIESFLMEPNIKVSLVFAHMGPAELSSEVRSVIDDYVIEQNDTVSDALSFQYLGQAEIHRLLLEKKPSASISIRVDLKNWSLIDGPP